uniref:YadA-like family protein n=1 Tax=Veillonella sp. CHU732 TaxID=2490949 RepID=UPI0013E0B6C3
KLGEELDIVGEGTVAETVATAANNIRTKNVGGKLEIGLVKDLKNITSITNAAPVDPTQPDAAKVASTTLTINGDALTVENKQADGKTATVTIGKDGIDAGGKTITNVAKPTNDKDAANKEYVDAQKWGLKIQNGDAAAEDVTAKDKAITLKASADTSDAADKPKKGIVIAKDGEGNITLGLEKADRTTLDNAVNLGNTGSDGRDGQAGKNATGVIAGSAGAQGPTGKDGLNGKDLTNKVNALRNGEAGTVVYTNAAGDRLVKANDGKYYKADEVEPNGEKKPGATAVDTKDVIASLVSPDGNTTGATNKLSNIADGAISKDSKDAVNGSQLFNERVTSPVIFVDKDGNQVFKTAEGKFVTKEGTAVADADLDKVHTKVNADKAMTLDNVASAVNNLTGTTYLDKLAEGAKADNKVANSAVNVTDLHSTANALVTKGLDFKGNLGDAIHKNLGETLEIVGEGTVAADATTAANNIRTKKTDDGKLEIGLVKDLTGITSITGGDANNDTKIELGKTGLKVTNTVTPAAGGAPETKTITIGKDGINADGTKITNVATPTDKADAANKEYVDAQKWGLKVQNGTDAATDVTPANKVVTFKTGTGTVAPTNLPAGQDSPTKDTDNVAPKKGIVLETDNQGNVTIGLEKADRTTLDHAANIGNTASDGRDGQAGAGKDGVAVAGSAGAQGPTGKDGLNGKDLTSKVNALRNGEAGTVVYTNAAGDRVVKANDGNYYKADEVKPDGNVKTETENGGKAPVAVSPEARLVSPDGTTTGAANKLSNIANGTISESSKDAVNGSQLFNERVTNPTIFVDKDGNQVFKTTDGKFVDKNGAEVPADKIHTKLNAGAPMTLDNVASVVENATVPNAADPNNVTFKEKLAAAAGDVATKHSAVNVEDLHKATADTSDALVTKGLNFQGNLGDAIHKDLGAKLDIVGEGTVAADATTAADNIRTKNVDGKLEIGIVKDLKNITSITNATTADGDGTKLTIDGDKLSVVNKKGTDKTTVTIGKDGINAGGTKITNVAEGAISKDSTDVVIGKQLHVTNEKVSNLEETKLNKTDDVHVKAGTYTVDDKTGTVALPLVKGDADTATSKNVTISGIVTHAALSNTMDAYELHIAGDKDSKATTTLKKGLAVRGAENFTPDAATKEKGINIQATATEGGVNIKLSDTLTKMKGITFTPAENSKEAVSLTSNGLDNGGHTITNVAAGQNDTDVVNVAQLKGIANVVGDVNNRLNRSSAQSAALAGLQTLQYDPLEPTQISAGVGYYKGSTALALGVGHYKNESTLFHVGASVNGHGDEVMANASVTWKFGSRATESAVKDTYRQGPISASYTLQDKVSALEAQNQIQSEKINAQNQVIEDLKAQLAEVLQYIKK